MQIKCQKCGRIVNVQENWDRNATCNKCGSQFIGGGTKGTFQGVESSFQQLGNHIQNKVPHVMIGKQGIHTQRQNQGINPLKHQNIPPQTPQNANFPQQTQTTESFPYHTKQEKTEAKIREIALWVCIGAIGIYAVYRLLLG